MSQKRATESERNKLQALAAQWEQEREGLEMLVTQTAHVAEVIDAWGYAEKRAALFALKADVILHEPGYTPRVELGINVLCDGRIPLVFPSLNNAAAEHASIDSVVIIV